MDREQIREILNKGELNSLIGEVENEWLECKGKPYDLEIERQKWELAKDVSGFANLKGGGILIGIKTETDQMHRGDVIKEIRAFEEGLIDREQYIKIIGDWVYPK